MVQKVVCEFTHAAKWTENKVQTTRPIEATKFATAVDERNFTGDMEGWGVANYTMAYYGPAGEWGPEQCAFAGLTYFEGTLLGKKGSFALNTRGTYDKGTINAFWLVATETATGELKGLTGKGGYTSSKVGDTFNQSGFLEVEMPGQAA